MVNKKRRISYLNVREILTCVRPVMSLQVGALGVGFPTAEEVAAVRRGAFSGPRPAPALLFAAQRLLLCVELQQ